MSCIRRLRIYSKYRWTRYDILVRRGAIATFIFLAAIAVLSFSNHCTVIMGEKVCDPKWSVFLSAKPNEIGDSLAGVAGALAFMWIIVTVMLQSKELSAQRQELQLTRVEMEGQRKAAEDMARAMSAQALVFEQEQKDRKAAAVDQELEAVLIEITKLIERKIHDKAKWVTALAPEKTPWHGDSGVSLSAYPGDSEDIDERLFRQWQDMISNIEQIEEGVKLDEFIVKPVFLEPCSELLALLKLTEEKRSNASQAFQSRLRKLNFEAFHREFSDFIRREDVWKEALS